MSLVLLFIYAEVLGANATGILLPAARQLTLFVLALLFIAWMLIRWRLGWRWYPNALDAAWLLWGLVLLLSLLANPEAARRILLALWYAGVYTALWYFLCDLLANKALSRETLVDVLLLGGSLVVIFACIQIVVALSSAGGRDLGFMETFNLRSLFSNANALATFLVVTALLILGRIARIRWLGARLLLVVYLVLLAGLLYLTNSRGAWISAAVGLLSWAVLELSRRRQWTVDSPRLGWQKLAYRTKAAMIASALVAAGLSVGAMLWLLRYLQQAGDSLAFRPQLFAAALNMFAEKPLTGYGLSSFGRHLPRFVSVPPNTPLSNAHNFPINLMGELGIIGLMGLLVIVAFILRAAYRNWLAASDVQRRTLSAVMAASVAYAVHHLLDITSVTVPAIALTGTALLVLLAAPNQAEALEHRRQGIARSLGITALWTLLLIAGFWDAGLYAGYTALLDKALIEKTYARSASELQSTADADPALMVYPAQQAFFWGLAASEGDEAAALQAMATYERLVEMEPYYAPFRANLGALYWQAGRQEEGLALMRSAAELAPDSWQLNFNAGAAAEALGQVDTALADYAIALAANPDADLHPAWDESLLRQEIHSQHEDRSDLGQVVRLIESGQAAEAATYWETSALYRTNPRYYVIWELIALAQNDEDAAAAYLEQARRANFLYEEDLWLLLAELRLARYRGDETLAAELSQTIEDRLTYSPTAPDSEFGGADIAFYQFFRQTTLRQFLPQVFYPGYRPVLYHLLAAGE